MAHKNTSIVPMNKIRRTITKRQYNSAIDDINKSFCDISKEAYSLSKVIQTVSQSIKQSSQQLSTAVKIMGYNGPPKRPTRVKPSREIDIIKCILDTEFNTDSAMYADSLKYTYYYDDIASVRIKYTIILHYQYVEDGKIRISVGDGATFSSHYEYRDIDIHDENSISEFVRCVKDIRKYYWLLFVLYNKILLRCGTACIIASYLLCVVAASAVVTAILHIFGSADLPIFKTLKAVSIPIGIMIFCAIPITCSVLNRKISNVISDYISRRHK